jgi:hypothetical protein
MYDKASKAFIFFFFLKSLSNVLRSESKVVKKTLFAISFMTLFFFVFFQTFWFFFMFIVTRIFGNTGDAWIVGFSFVAGLNLICALGILFYIKYTLNNLSFYPALKNMIHETYLAKLINR